MRLREFQSYLSDKRIDAALFTSLGMEADPNFFYFTQYRGHGALIIPRSGKPTLLVSKMEQERAQKSRIRHVVPLEKKRLYESVNEHLKKVKTLGVDFSSLTLLSLKALKKSIKGKRIGDISRRVEDLRLIKTREESAFLKTSCEQADSILKKCLSNFREFKTESEVAAYLQYETFRRGLDVSFKPIVASGKNASMPHYEPKDIRLNPGLCVIDFGVKYKGYCSDITRTIGIKVVKKDQKAMYEKLLKIQEDSILHITEGKSCGTIYSDVVSALGKNAPYFTHGLGHGIGDEIHELPNLTLNSKDCIRNGMYFTIEPGVYFPKRFGIRIEDSVMLGKRPIQLTKTAKELTIL